MKSYEQMDFESENIDVSNVIPVTTPRQKINMSSMTSEKSRSKILIKQRIDGAPRTPLSSKSPETTQRSGQRDAARDAKLQNTAEKLNTVANLRERWQREKEMKQILTSDKRLAEQKLLHEVSLKEAEIRKNRASARREEEKRKLKAEQEFLESSHLDRAHQIREQELLEKKRRKQSVMLNNNIKRQWREKEVELEQKKKGEEADFLEGRRKDHLDVREAKSAEKDRRRESMCCRYYSCIFWF